jgi:hypothetical protein
MRGSSFVRGLFAVLLACGGSIRVSQAQETSTPEELAQWAATTHQLESSPLDDAVSAQGDAAVKRIMDVHDFHVALCQGYFEEFRGLHYTYQRAVLRQYMLAAAAFQVEHPDKAGDYFGTNLYAVESVLKVYGAILAAKPDAKSRVLDGLEKQQRDGKLDDEVRKQCHG